MKKLAILGPAGTYSDIAVKKLKEAYEKEYFPSFLQAVQALDATTDVLVPFENTLDGFVMESLDAIAGRDGFIAEQVKLNVNFSLVSLAEAIDEIEEVYVQFKAYGQCSKFFSTHKVKPIFTQSNMESLSLLKGSTQRNVAAIIPKHCEVKEFPLVLENIADSMDNETRFVRITKNPSNNATQWATCSVVVVPHMDKSGILFSILQSFHNHQINLKAILSRPRRDSIGHYIFYLEFDIELKDIASLEEIRKELKEHAFGNMKLIGIYNRLEEELCEQ